MTSQLFAACLLLAVAVSQARTAFRRHHIGRVHADPVATTVEPAVAVTCGSDRPLKCPNQEHCISFTQLCNGVRDCQDGADERGLICARSACPDGFSLHNERCYKLVTTTMSWNAAGLHCASLHRGAHLIFINNAREQSTVENMVSAHSETRWWLGLERVDNAWMNRAHSTTNGSVTSFPTTYTNWGPSEPNNANTGESCAELMNMSWWNARWNDDSCNILKRSICEIEFDDRRHK